MNLVLLLVPIIVWKFNLGKVLKKSGIFHTFQNPPTPLGKGEKNKNNIV